MKSYTVQKKRTEKPKLNKKVNKPKMQEKHNQTL